MAVVSKVPVAAAIIRIQPVDPPVEGTSYQPLGQFGNGQKLPPLHARYYSPEINIIAVPVNEKAVRRGGIETRFVRL